MVNYIWLIVGAIALALVWKLVVWVYEIVGDAFSWILSAISWLMTNTVYVTIELYNTAPEIFYTAAGIYAFLFAVFPISSKILKYPAFNNLITIAVAFSLLAVNIAFWIYSYNPLNLLLLLLIFIPFIPLFIHYKRKTLNLFIAYLLTSTIAIIFSSEFFALVSPILPEAVLSFSITYVDVLVYTLIIAPFPYAMYEQVQFSRKQAELASSNEDYKRLKLKYEKIPLVKVTSFFDLEQFLQHNRGNATRTKDLFFEFVLNSKIKLLNEYLNTQHLDINTLNSLGYSAAMLAANKNDVKMLEFLKDKSVDFETPKNKAGNDALNLAILANSKEAAKYLLDMAFKSIGSAFLTAAIRDNRTLLDYLISEHNVNINVENTNAQSALDLALTKNSTKVIKKLYELNVNFQTTADNMKALASALFQTACSNISQAVELNNIELVKLFVKHGGDTNEALVKAASTPGTENILLYLSGLNK